MIMRHAQALFPVKVAGAGCKLNRVEVSAYPQLHSGRKSCPSGKSDEVKRLLGYARYGEGIEAVDMDVVVHMDDLDFDEGSYGLALAISDKQARFGAADDVFDTIIATGIIANQGRVERIGALADKLNSVLDQHGAGAVFVFPTANREPPEPEVENGLAALTAKGITWRAVASISELADLWRQPAPSDEVATSSQPRTTAAPTWHNRLSLFAKGLLLGFLLILGLAAGLALLLAHD